MLMNSLLSGVNLLALKWREIQLPKLFRMQDMPALEALESFAILTDMEDQIQGYGVSGFPHEEI
jgi:hypothetical protein